MRNKLLALSVIIFFFMALLVVLKLRTYKILTSKEYSHISFDAKTTAFYVDHLTFPKNESEFKAYISKVNDREYIETLSKFTYHYRYDSINKEVWIYSNGMDWDDDKLSLSSRPIDLSFFDAIFVDGDVIIQHVKLNDIVNELKYKVVIINNDSLVKDQSLRYKIKNDFNCLVSNLKLESSNSTSSPSDLWIRISINNKIVTSEIYGELPDAVASSLEEGVASMVTENDFYHLKGHSEIGLYQDYADHPPLFDCQ